MKLMIGGYAQGKLNYVGKSYDLTKAVILDGSIPLDFEKQQGTVIVNHLHHWIKNRIAEGGCPEEEILLFIEKQPDCVILCDEIGNGIVPLEAFEREYRERTGRILIKLAERAEEVERVICGMGQRIK